MQEYDAGTIYKLIERSWKKAGYSVFPQVRSRPGSGSEGIRSADALAISQSALRDTNFIGFEIKISKADFKTELSNPAKADAIAQYCNRWYLVAPKGIIPINEVPEKWGLLEIANNKVYTTINATELPALPPSREFVAMIIRKIEEYVKPKDEYWKGYAEGVETAKQNQDKVNTANKEQLDRIRDAIRVFEARSGISFSYWSDHNDAAQIGKAVKLIMENRVIDRLETTQERLEELLVEVKDAKKQIGKSNVITLLQDQKALTQNNELS